MASRTHATTPSCKLCHRTCCERPAPVSYDQLAHDRGECVADEDSETRWWFQCWTCNTICKCEV